MTILRRNTCKNCEPQKNRGLLPRRFLSKRMIDSMTQSLRAEGYNVSKEQVRKTTQDYIRSR